MLLSLLYIFVNFLEVSTCFVFSCWSSFFYNIVILDFEQHPPLLFFVFIFHYRNHHHRGRRNCCNWHFLIKETSRARYFFLQYFFYSIFFLLLLHVYLSRQQGTKEKGLMMEVLPSCMYSSLRNLHNKYKNVSF